MVCPNLVRRGPLDVQSCSFATTTGGRIVVRRPPGALNVIVSAPTELAGSIRRGGSIYARGMRVEVNTDLCQGHNRCYALAPELFDVDDYGTAVVIGDGTVAPELEEKARLAVANCPEYAIIISDDE